MTFERLFCHDAERRADLLSRVWVEHQADAADETNGNQRHDGEQHNKEGRRGGAGAGVVGAG